MSGDEDGKTQLGGTGTAGAPQGYHSLYGFSTFSWLMHLLESSQTSYMVGQDFDTNIPQEN